MHLRYKQLTTQMGFIITYFKNTASNPIYILLGLVSYFLPCKLFSGFKQMWLCPRRSPISYHRSLSLLQLSAYQSTLKNLQSFTIQLKYLLLLLLVIVIVYSLETCKCEKIPCGYSIKINTHLKIFKLTKAIQMEDILVSLEEWKKRLFFFLDFKF